MNYKPVTAVWEITMGCNLRCKHCGSSCENALEGELTTDEAINLCKDLGALGLKWLTLSGGEPTIRKDWHIIAKSLTDNGVIPNIITNGWILNGEIIEKAVQANVNTMAISLDGTRKTHDNIRREGSFDRIMNSFDLLKENNKINAAAITTISKQNINELPEILEILNEKEVSSWQLQIGLPMGNMLNNIENIIVPSDVKTIIDFAHSSLNTKVRIRLADCLGYFNNKEIEVRTSKNAEEYNWNGCNAGKYSLGILHNGDIIGCTSVRDKEYIEGNIRNTPIKEIWESEDSFKWNRQLTKEKLKGFCQKCLFGERCLGGCANTRVTMEKDIYGENKYCLYNYAFKIAENELTKENDINILYNKAEKFINNNNNQLAEICLGKIISIDENYKKALSLYGYVSFMLNNYSESKKANEKILNKNPNDSYANKGLGLCLSKLGDLNGAIYHLEKSIEYTNDDYLDPYYDLAVTYYEHKNIDKSISTLEKAFEKNISYKSKVQEFYNILKNEQKIRS